VPGLLGRPAGVAETDPSCMNAIITESQSRVDWPDALAATPVGVERAMPAMAAPWVLRLKKRILRGTGGLEPARQTRPLVWATRPQRRQSL